MEDDECEGDSHGDHDDDLGGVEPPLLVLHVVQEGVGQRLRLRHPVVRQGQARRRRHPREEYPHEGLQDCESCYFNVINKCLLIYYNNEF